MGGQPLGSLAWGTPLNAELTSDETNITTLQSSVTNHENNVAPVGGTPPGTGDPHGDRAFAQNLVTPITTGVNGPNGYVVCGPDGKIPLSCVPVGAGLQNLIDAVPDYHVPFDGSTDAAPSLNAALAQTNVNGGGIVWVGNGQFALGSPLIIYPNTWLWCSPGAIFTRKVFTTPPRAMVQNYGGSIPPGNGNIFIIGGTWDIATISSSGVAFSFVNADFITIRDMGIIGFPDGNSPIAEFFGCGNVTLDNLQVTSAVPLNPGRGNQHHPCFRFDECRSENIPGLPFPFYTHQTCSNILVKGCSHTCGVLSDSNGPYSGWSSFCGSTGVVTTNAQHVNINIIDGCFGTAFAVAGVEAVNWVNVTCVGNNFSYPAAPYTIRWNGSLVTLGNFPFANSFNFGVCSPPCIAPNITNITVINTIVETIVNQFVIPANDFIPGNTCYKHHHGGVITCPAGATLTFKIYVGGNGNTSDLLCETFVITFANAHTNDPYCFHHKGFDCDDDGKFRPCGTEFYCGSGTVGHDEHFFHCGGVAPQPTPGSPCYVTHTHSWDSANNNRSCESRHGNHERDRQ